MRVKLRLQRNDGVQGAGRPAWAIAVYDIQPGLIATDMTAPMIDLYAKPDRGAGFAAPP